MISEENVLGFFHTLSTAPMPCTIKRVLISFNIFRLKMFAFYFCITLPRFTLPPLVCCEQFSTLLPTFLTNEAFGNFVYNVRWRKLDAILNFSKKYGLKLCKLEQRNTRRKITILQHSGGMLSYLHSCFNKTSRCF